MCILSESSHKKSNKLHFFASNDITWHDLSEKRFYVRYDMCGFFSLFESWVICTRLCKSPITYLNHAIVKLENVLSGCTQIYIYNSRIACIGRHTPALHEQYLNKNSFLLLPMVISMRQAVRKLMKCREWYQVFYLVDGVPVDCNVDIYPVKW
jgi:hypothetical protein